VSISAGKEDFMNDFSSRKFTNDEVSRIIRQSLTLEDKDTVDFHGLLEIGAELGIDPGKIQEAINREDAAQQDHGLREKWLARQRTEFREHLWAYLIINAALLLINLFSPGPWWFQWPLLGWGIGLAFHYRESHYPSEEAIEKGIHKLARLEQKKRKKQERVKSPLSSQL